MSEQGNDQTAQMVTPPPAADVPPPPPPMAPPPPPMVPPPPPMASPTRELVRDPYTKLGGVASGLAHYFGVDVSIVRLAFILLVPISGIGLMVYLLAWLVVPRAKYWPPVGATRPSHSISTRELGIGLVILLILLALFANGGFLARTMVPILLVAGGVWMLRQPGSVPADPVVPSGHAGPTGSVGASGSEFGPSPLAPSPFAPSPFAPSAAAPSPFAPSDATQPADTIADPLDDPFGTPPPIPPRVDQSAPGSGPAPGAPVPPRRRRWLRRILWLLFAAFILVLLVAALAIGALFGGVANMGFGFSARYQPEAVAELPAAIQHDAGDIELDLTHLTTADFGDGPVRLDIEVDAGEVRVIVPDGLPVSVDARVEVGDARVFDENQGGFDLSIDRPDDDAVLDLDIELGFGQVTVERGDPADPGDQPGG